MSLEKQVEILDREGCNEGEIADQLGISVEAARYRLEVSNREREIGDMEYLDGARRDMERIVVNVAKFGEEEGNRLKAAMWAVEVSRGIRKNRSDLPNIPVVAINQAIMLGNSWVESFIRNGQRGNEQVAAQPLNGDVAEGDVVEQCHNNDREHLHNENEKGTCPTPNL